MLNYKLGLCSISFRDKSPEEILSAMKNAGLSYIEWGSDVHAPKGDVEKINKIIKLQKKYRIECSSYGTYFRLGETPIEELEEYIATAKLLGTDILRLWCGDKDSEKYTITEKENLFGVCKKAAEIAELSKAENTIEELVKAKGFSECVAFIDGETASVVVATNGLSEEQAAQIFDIVLSKTKINSENINIVETK